MPDEREPLRRLSLTFSFDQGLLEVEGKSEQSGRLYSNEFRGAVAAAFIKAIAARLATSNADKTSILLRVNRDNFTILPDGRVPKKG